MRGDPARHTITLRRATDADANDLARLAELDSRRLPPAPRLLAERGGAIEAAISLRSGEIVANPFVRTAELCELLVLHAASVGSEPAPAATGSRWRPRPIGATA